MIKHINNVKSPFKQGLRVVKAPTGSMSDRDTPRPPRMGARIVDESMMNTVRISGGLLKPHDMEP